MENLKTFFFTAISQTPVTCNTTYANEFRMSRSTKPIWPYDGKLLTRHHQRTAADHVYFLGSPIFCKRVHFLSRKMVYLALVLLRYLSFSKVDSLMDLLSKLVYGDLTQVRHSQAKRGPFLYEDQVLPAEIGSIRGSHVELKKGKSYQFESIVFCTGFKTSTSLWLKADDYLLKEDGIPRPSSPNHWKEQKVWSQNLVNHLSSGYLLH